MSKGFNIRAYLGLETGKFNKGLKNARGKLTSFQKGLRGVNDTLRGLQFAAIGVTAVGAFSRAINTVKDFQTNMARVQVITESNTETMARLTDAARDIGASTRFSASEAASGLQFLGMAGLSADESLSALPATLNLAGAGAIEVGRSADIVTNVLAGFNLATSEATRVSDLFAQASRSSNQTVEELYGGIKLAAPAYNQLGLSVEQAATDLALLANNGIKAEHAGVALTGALSRLLRQPPLVANALDELGVSVTENKIKQVGLIGVIQELRDAGIDATQMTEILGLHWKTTGALISATDEQIASMSDKMRDSKDAAKDMSENGIGSIDEAIKLLSSAIDELFISLDSQDSILVKLINGLRDLILWFGGLSKAGKVFQVVLVTMAFKGKAVISFFVGFGRQIKLLTILAKRGSLSMKALGASFKSAMGYLGFALIAIELITVAMSNYKSETDKVLDANKKLKSFKDGLGSKDEKGVASELVKAKLAKKAAREELKIAQEKYNKLNSYYKGAANADAIMADAKSKQFDAQTKYNKANAEYDATRLELFKREIAANKAKGATDAQAAAEAEAKAAQATIDAQAEIAAFNKVLKSRYDEYKTLNEIKAAVKVLESAKGDAHDADRSAIIEQITLLKKYQSELESVGSMPTEKIKVKTPQVTSSGGESGSIDTSELKYMDQINASMEERIKLSEKLANQTGMSQLTDEVFSFANSQQLAATAIGGTMDAISTLAETGELSFQSMVTSTLAGIGQIIQGLMVQAMAEQVASNAKFGLPGLAMAAVGIAATQGIIASLPAFENGGIMDGKGIIGGNSYSGDNNIARVNTGEMVITRGDQNRLWKEIKGGGNSGGSGKIKMTASGNSLTAVVSRNQLQKKRFKG